VRLSAEEFHRSCQCRPAGTRHPTNVLPTPRFSVSQRNAADCSHAEYNSIQININNLRTTEHDYIKINKKYKYNLGIKARSASLYSHLVASMSNARQLAKQVTFIRERHKLIGISTACLRCKKVIYKIQW